MKVSIACLVLVVGVVFAEVLPALNKPTRADIQGWLKKIASCAEVPKNKYEQLNGDVTSFLNGLDDCRKNAANAENELQNGKATEQLTKAINQFVADSKAMEADVVAEGHSVFAKAIANFPLNCCDAAANAGKCDQYISDISKEVAVFLKKTTDRYNIILGNYEKAKADIPEKKTISPATLRVLAG